MTGNSPSEQGVGCENCMGRGCHQCAETVANPNWVAILMGFDAMRICLGLPANTYEYDEVLLWMDKMREQCLQRRSTSAAELNDT